MIEGERLPTLRTCSYRRCRHRFAPRNWRHRFCSPECNVLWLSGQHARRPMPRRRKYNGFVTRARRETRGRVCLMCRTEPLRGNQRVSCSSQECKRAYWAEHKREQRQAERRITKGTS